jgi:hypothetical protein
MVRVPGATLQTLIEAIRDPTPYGNVIDTLPEAPRDYLRHEYGRVRPETRNAIKDRIYDLRMISPAFDAMFGASRNCLDLPSALDNGKIVLVNLDRDYLEKEPSAILGKWFISQTYRAALRRSKIPEAKRRPAYLIADEAGPYFDEQTEDVLRTMRSYRVGAVLAFQEFGPISPTLKSAMFANTSIKMAGGKSHDDARALAESLHTTADFIVSREKVDYSHSDFACYVDRLTKRAVSVSVPHGVLDAQPTMTAEQYERLRASHRAPAPVEASVASPPQPAPRAAPHTEGVGPVIDVEYKDVTDDRDGDTDPKPWRK